MLEIVEHIYIHIYVLDAVLYSSECGGTNWIRVRVSFSGVYRSIRRGKKLNVDK